MNSTTKFGADNRGTVACHHCHKLTWDKYARTLGVNGETCGDCANEFMAENEHNDYGNHDTYGIAFESICPICHPERRESRMAKVEAHNAKLSIKVEERTRDARIKAERKAAEKAAKEASIKRCADCKDGRASSTSDYCSVCRPYNPHTATKLSKSDRENFARRGWNLEACGTCGKDKSDGLHS